MKISLRLRDKAVSFTQPASDDTVIFVNPTFTSAGTYIFTLPTGTTIDLTPETVYSVGIDINNADGDGGGESGVTARYHHGDRRRLRRCGRVDD